ncbi:MAG: FAD-binding protein [Lachnospiraceae bacterium]|nr:FAD-binding protein [Lachnospiraceae bacterium]
MKKMECDVAVVALGLSGLANAIAAAEQGLSVIGFEKMRITGGAANMGMGPCAIESRVQKQKQLTLTREEAFMQHMNYTHWSVDARLVHDYYWKTADTIDWLMDMGVNFEVAPYFPMAYWTAHNVIPDDGGKPGPRGASTMVRRMTERAEQMGVQMMFECPVKKILMEDGKAVGILAIDANGEEIECRAKAVSICTGGIGDNYEMKKEITGRDGSEGENFAQVPGLKGDGLRMAWEAGVGRSPVLAEFNVGIHDNFNHWILEGAYRTKAELMVNLDGERFMNEEMSQMGTFCGNQILRQKGHVAFEIIDSDRVKYQMKHGPELLDEVHGSDFFEHFFEAADAAMQEPDYANKYFFKTDSIEELADLAGINKENLVKTIEEYNNACDHGYDDILCKSRRYMNPVRKPPFYTMKMILQETSNAGGILTDRRMRCLTQEGDIVPGLYACGTDANGLYGTAYNFYIPGNHMGFALNSGRIAAEAMAEYILG